MFRWLHTYYNNVIDKPSTIFPLNVWSFVNLRYFKFKFLKSIYVFIVTADNLRIKYVNVLYRDLIFEVIYSRLLNYIIILSIVFFIL